MPIDPHRLAALALAYAQGMSSIRGRRVQRLLKREFAGAEQVAIVTMNNGARAVLGRTAQGAACCATNGRGAYAAVLKWHTGEQQALEGRFDLLKDSLPLLEQRLTDLPSIPSGH